MSAAASAASALGRIGNTPMIPLPFPEPGLVPHATAEFLNPSGSIKDRLARPVLDEAQLRGLLRRDSIVVECSSGSTGIALAMVRAVKGLAVRIFMSASARWSRPRRRCCPGSVRAVM